MVRIARDVEARGGSNDVRMLIQVHDELVFEVRNARVREAVPRLISLMETIIPLSDTNGVPIIAEAKTGKNWEEMEKF